MNDGIVADRDVLALEERVRKLAGEKSSLELVIALMNRLSESPGLDTTIGNMLHAVADVIGGVNFILYYLRDGEIHSTDMHGSVVRHETLADALVRNVFATRRPEEIELPFEDTRMTTEEFAHAYTWAVPLVVEAELIGVFKIECLHLSMKEMPRELTTFFSYAALVLKNRILGHSRLQRAYAALSQEVATRRQAQEDLLVLNRELEERVWARTAQLQQANEQLRVSGEKANQLAAIVQSSDDAIIGKDLNGVITSWNRGAERIYGYSELEAIGQPISLLLPPGHEDEGNAILRRIIAGAHIEHYESVRRTSAGEMRLMSLTVSPVRDADGTIIAASTIARDITEKKRAEDALRRSLHEKEIMLKEIHHRVKNNLQIISSLLNLQAARYRDAEILRAFDESQRRVRTMAMVHEQLYRSENFASIDFGENLRRITRELMSAYGRPGVQFVIDVEPVVLAIDNAIPCGLIANELLSNALKHAFPGGRQGTIIVSLRMTDSSHARMLISDDGVGLPGGTPACANPSTLGMTLVTALAEQIDGTLTCSGGPGCAFTLVMPLASIDVHAATS